MSFLHDPPQYAIPARAGFSGAVAYDVSGVQHMIRAESCDVTAKQDINAIPDVDGAIDHTRYSLQPYAIDGNIAFALDQSQTADSFLVFEQLFNDAVLRDSTGQLEATDRRLHVRYYPGYSYTYLDMHINTFNLSVSQGDVLKATASMMGRGRKANEFQPNFDQNSDLAPVRVIQFNDIEIAILPDSSMASTDATISEPITSTVVRSFDMSINNNCEAIYTLSSALTPYDIIAKKREISGSFTFAGKQDELAEWATAHESRAQSSVDLIFRVKFGSDTTVDLFRLKGVVPQIESVNITNDLVETTMNWRAYGNQGFEFEAISGFNNINTNANAVNLPFGTL
tara:strand:+ start:4438 stop:5460 length:1023 start_codon:yes stop_codon:yes gene_type:complete